MGEEGAHLATDHAAYDLLYGRLLYCASSDLSAVAEHGEGVAKFKDLFDAMRDKDDAQSACT